MSHRWLTIALACSSLLGCDRRADAGAKTNATNTGEAKTDLSPSTHHEMGPAPTPRATPTDTPLPAFTQEVGEAGLDAAEAPPGSPTLAWRFEAGETWRYDYEQRLESKTEVEIEGSAPSEAREALESGGSYVGLLEVTATSDGAADVRVEVDNDRSEGPPVSGAIDYEDLLRPRGELDRSPDPLIASLLTPPASLPAIDEPIVEPLHMPFDLGGRAREVPGTRTMILRRWVRCGPSICAEFETKVHIERQTLDGPRMSAELAVDARGFAVFDVAGSLYHARAATRMVIVNSPKGGGRVSMTQEHLHDLERREAPEVVP